MVRSGPLVHRWSILRTSGTQEGLVHSLLKLGVVAAGLLECRVSTPSKPVADPSSGRDWIASCDRPASERSPKASLQSIGMALERPFQGFRCGSVRAGAGTSWSIVESSNAYRTTYMRWDGVVPVDIVLSPDGTSGSSNYAI